MNAARSFLFILVVPLLLAGCERAAPEPLVLSGLTMGTSWEVKIADRPSCQPTEAIRRSILAVLDDVDRTMSTWRPDSELSRFNAARDGDWHELPEGLFAVLEEGRIAGELSGGAFDMTIGPIVALWGFGPGDRGHRIPSAEALAAARERVGYARLELDPVRNAARKQDPGVEIDVNGIAPGYAVDRIAAAIDQAGCANFLVELGGEIHARGPGANGSGWRIGIEAPIAGRRAVQRVIPLLDAGLATSGEYRDFFEQDGVRYGHTIDPATGRPIRHDTVSVTVIHPDTVRADALATALLVLGAERGFVLASRQEIPALFIMRRGDELVELPSPAFEALE